MSDTEFEPEYLKGIEHFNAHEFFEAHEVWEDVWARTTGRSQLFYKGLIHAAVALHHFGNGNLRGARKVWGSCRQYLAPYAPRYLNLDVQQFLDAMRQCFAGLETTASVDSSVQLEELKIPRIELDPAPGSAHDRSDL
jgi:predicted metal-dependent hydrolase